MGTLHKCLAERRYSQFAFLAKHHSAAVNARDERGRTPLHHCCLLGDDAWAVSCARMLLHLEAEPGAVDVDGRTPLHYACKDGKLSVVRALLQLVPDICVDAVDNDGNAPLHFAAARGDEPLLGLLLTYYGRFELDIERKNVVGFTPLQLAAANGHLDAARALVAVGGASATRRDDAFFKNASEWLAAYYHDCDSPADVPFYDPGGDRRRRSAEETRRILARWKTIREADYDFSRLPLGGSGGKAEPLFLAFNPSSSTRRSRAAAAAAGTRKRVVPQRGALELKAAADEAAAARGGGTMLIGSTSLLSASLAGALDGGVGGDSGSGSGGGGSLAPTSWSMLRSVTDVQLEQLTASYRRPSPSRASTAIAAAIAAAAAGGAASKE